jgi:GH25 family lysozyme M1 (1,4-beta-N-acetylmuramidase)
MRLKSLCLFAIAIFVGCGSPTPVGEFGQPLTTACAPANTIKGFDINGPAVNWTTAATGYRFAYVKATEGTYFINGNYTADAAGARAAGMYVGGYHYLVWSSSGADQANYFVKELGGSVPNGDLPPVADIEDVYADDLSSTTVADRVTIISDFLTTVQSLTGRQPMIYSGNWYWTDASYLNNPTQFSAYPIWWSAYTTGCPTIPDSFPKLTIWQNAGSVACTGVSGATGCDTDLFYGTEADLAALANANAYAGQSLGVTSQSYPISSAGAVDLTVGQTVTGWIKLKNIGTATWAPGVVKLAPIPRDQSSPYHASSWLAANRISTVQASTPPGSVGTFELDIEGSAVGNGMLQLGFVAEGITWFADQGGPADGYFEVAVDVTAAPDTGAPATDAGHVDAADASGVGDADSATKTDASGAGDADSAAKTDAGEAGDAGSRDAESDARNDVGLDAGESGGAAAKGSCSCRLPVASPNGWSLPLALIVALGRLARWRRRIAV